MRVTCEKELGTWTVRLDGKFVADFWSEKKARRLTYYLVRALGEA